MKNYWLIGDIHGDHAVIYNFYNQHKDELSDSYEDNILIVLGDFGANYFLNKRDDFFKEKISRFPLTYFVIRGNHEERPSILMEKYPSDWHKERFFGNSVYVEDRFPKLLYALDEGGTYYIEDKKVLVVPGAYSVDKWYRLYRGWSWFPTEQLTKEERDNLLNNLDNPYDYIFAHTCPSRWFLLIKDLFLPSVEQDAVDKTMEDFLDELTSQTDYKHFYFGHYHDNRDLFSGATMLFHETLPLGETYKSYQEKTLKEKYGEITKVS